MSDFPASSELHRLRAELALTQDERDAWRYRANRSGKMLGDELVRAAGYLHKLAAAEEQAESFKAMYHQACGWRDAKIEALEAALAKAVADEREACALIVDQFVMLSGNEIRPQYSVKENKQAVLRDLARNIRTRGAKP